MAHIPNEMKHHRAAIGLSASPIGLLFPSFSGTAVSGISPSRISQHFVRLLRFEDEMKQGRKTFCVVKRGGELLAQGGKIFFCVGGKSENSVGPRSRGRK